MKELAFARQRTIERLGETVPDIPIASAVDFILPVNCRRSTTAVRAASATAVKMNSSQVEPRHAGRHAACEDAPARGAAWRGGAVAWGARSAAGGARFRMKVTVPARRY